jgi:hypothetical protein
LRPLASPQPLRAAQTLVQRNRLQLIQDSRACISLGCKSALHRQTRHCGAMVATLTD